MTDTESNSPETQNASAIDEADLDQVIGGDKATTTAPTTSKTSTSGIHFTKTVDAPSPNLFLG